MHGGLVMAKSGRLELGDNVYGQNLQPLWSKAIEFGEKNAK